MITMEGISKSYKNINYINEFNYIFNDGEKYIIRGPSGCGKTTLLRMIAGFEKQDTGRISIDNRLISDKKIHKEPKNRGIGMVFQDPYLWEHMTVRKNIEFGLSDNKDRIYKNQDIIEVLNLQDILEKQPREISGGEAKRVALARMMILKWKYLLLDEPLTHIDQKLSYKIIDFINTYVKENNTTLLYVTHDLEMGKSLDGIKLKLEDIMGEL